MTITVSWKGGTSDTVTLDPGQTFARMGIGRPDVHVVTRGNHSALLIRNGYVSASKPAEQYGTLRGRLVVTMGGDVLTNEDVEIPDGTSLVYSKPGILGVLPSPSVDWLLRDCVGWSKVTRDAIGKYFLAVNPYYNGKPGIRRHEPDVAGSPELTEYEWRGALGAAFLQKSGVATDPASPFQMKFRAAASDRTRTAFWVPCGYYGDGGEPWRFSEHPEMLVGETGLQKSGKSIIDRPSESLFQFADAEHLTIDGEWADAVLYGSPAAWLWLEHVGEAMCSWPMAREIATHGNLRAYTRFIKAMSKLVGLFPGKPQFALALSNAYAALAASCGTTADGIPYANLRPAQAIDLNYLDPKKAQTHIAAGPLDLAAHPDWTEAEAKDRFRGVIVEWVGSALTALGIARAIPAAAKCCPNIALTMSHLGACLDHAAGSFTDNTGLPIIGEPWVDSYAWQVKDRAKRANLPYRGTEDWTACGAGSLLRAGLASAATMDRIHDALGKMPDAQIGTPQAVECFWSLLGSSQ